MDSSTVSVPPKSPGLTFSATGTLPLCLTFSLGFTDVDPTGMPTSRDRIPSWVTGPVVAGTNEKKKSVEV